MKMAYALMFLLGLTQVTGLRAHASATHLGKIDLDLSLVDQKGKSDKIESENVAFRLDWITKKCEMIVKGQYAYCNLDLTRDLLNPKGELIMKSMPQAHFDAKTIDAVIGLLAKEDKKTRDIINTVLTSTAGERAKGFDLPFYTCGNEFSPNPDCSKNGKDLLLFNAFGRAKTNGSPSYVLRQIEINHPSLGGKKLVLKLKLHDIDPQGGAFNIIGNNNAGNFGTH
jgi:hypothetical protein